MSAALVVCPSCGARVAQARFCTACGKPLSGIAIPYESTLSSSPSAPADLTSGLVASVSGTQQFPEFGVTIGAMDQRTLSVLLARAELDLIDRDLDELIRQIQATRQALSLKHADKAVLTARAETLRDSLDRTKNRRAELMSMKGPLAIETILSELKSEESKLSKLEGLKGSVDDEVYEEQRQLLIAGVKKMKKELKVAVKDAHEWLKSMSKKAKELRREASRLDARHKIGDISTQVFDESRSRVDRSIRVLEGGREVLESMVAMAEQG